MALTVVPFSDDQVSLGETESAFELLTKNTLTTAGVLVAAGTGVAGAAVLTAALPAQMAVAATLSGGLIYAGDRQAKGLPINPFNKESNEEKPAVNDGESQPAAA